MNENIATHRLDDGVYKNEDFDAEKNVQERATYGLKELIEPSNPDHSRETAPDALVRLNFMLTAADSQYLDEVVAEFGERGVRVSRSEVLRAAIAAFREIQNLSTRSSLGFSMDSAKDGTQLASLAFLVVRALYVGRSR